MRTVALISLLFLKHCWLTRWVSPRWNSDGGKKDGQNEGSPVVLVVISFCSLHLKGQPGYLHSKSRCLRSQIAYGKTLVSKYRT